MNALKLILISFTDLIFPINFEHINLQNELLETSNEMSPITRHILELIRNHHTV